MESLLYEINKYQLSKDSKALEILYIEFKEIIESISKSLKYEDAQADLIYKFIELIYRLKLEHFECDLDLKKYISKSLKYKKYDLQKKYINKKMNCLELDLEIIGEKSFEQKLVNHIVLKRYIKFLTEKQKLVLDLYFLKHYTEEEIGKIFGKSSQSVGRIKNRAINKLRELII